MTWPMVALGDLAPAGGKYGVGLSSRPWRKEDPRYIRITDIRDDGALNAEVVAPSGEPDEWNDALLQEGDLLFARSGATVGKTYLHPRGAGAAVFAGYLIRFQVDASRVLPRYVYHYTKGADYRSWVAVSQRAVAQPNINAKQFASLQIPLPPLGDQRRIAEILDRADALIAKRREIAQAMDRLCRAIFLDTFGDPFSNAHGWDLASLGEVAEKFSDGPFGTNLKSSHYVPSGVRVIRLQNIGVGEFIDRDKAFVSEEHSLKLRRHECRPGDVLIGTLGDPNLRACIIPDWLDISLNKADCVQMRVDTKRCTADYICALLNEPSVLSLANGLVLGQTRSRISMGRLRELKVPIPPLSVQEHFGARTAKIGQVQQMSERRTHSESKLFASLQSRAFSGQL